MPLAQRQLRIYQLHHLMVVGPYIIYLCVYIYVNKSVVKTRDLSSAPFVNCVLQAVHNTGVYGYRSTSRENVNLSFFLDWKGGEAP